MTWDFIKENLSCRTYKKNSQMRCEPRHQMHRWIELLLMVVNESFYTVTHDIPYSPRRRKHMDPIQTQPCCFIYMIVSCLFFCLWLSPPARPSSSISPPDENSEGTGSVQTFLTPTVLDYTTALYPSDEATETSFPVKSIIFKWAFTFFSFATRHKVIKSWKQTLKEALSKKEKLLW